MDAGSFDWHGAGLRWARSPSAAESRPQRCGSTNGKARSAATAPPATSGATTGNVLCRIAMIRACQRVGPPAPAKAQPGRLTATVITDTGARTERSIWLP